MLVDVAECVANNLGKGLGLKLLILNEHEIHEITNRLAAALLEQKVQASLDSDGMTEAEKAMIEKHPKRLRSEGKKISRRTHIVRM